MIKFFVCAGNESTFLIDFSRLFLRIFLKVRALFLKTDSRAPLRPTRNRDFYRRHLCCGNYTK